MINVKELSNLGYTFLPPMPYEKRQILRSCIDKLDLNSTYTNQKELGIKALNILELKNEDIKILHQRIFQEPACQNSYFILRKVEPGQISEGFRSHFDSHRFTIVVPISIPSKPQGSLYFFPFLRKEPKNSFSNLFSKILWKFFSNRIGFYIIKKIFKYNTEDFSTYAPMIFLGRSTFHGNFPIDSNSNEARITLLLHFFDPDINGIGKILRKIRNR